jgi:multicomponent Na+:H+ antiporter subunit B
MKRRRIIALIIGLCFAAVFWMTKQTQTVAEAPIAAYYIKNAYHDTASVNVVTGIYLNYRYYDTLFEALMLLFSIIGVIYMSIHEGGEHDE